MLLNRQLFFSSADRNKIRLIDCYLEKTLINSAFDKRNTGTKKIEVNCN